MFQWTTKAACPKAHEDQPLVDCKAKHWLYGQAIDFSKFGDETFTVCMAVIYDEYFKCASGAYLMNYVTH